MSMRRAMLAVGASVVALVVGAVVVPGTASAASAYEWNTAVAGTPPSWGPNDCVSMTGAKACFQKYGDKWWVLDTSSDGHSATASWTNLLGPDIVTYRQGSCVNKLGSGHWGVCNKDYYEWSSDNPYGQGSYLDWEACIYDSANGTWHGCSGQNLVDNDE